MEKTVVSRWPARVAAIWIVLFTGLLCVFLRIFHEYDAEAFRNLSLFFLLANVPVIAVTFAATKLATRLCAPLAKRPSDAVARFFPSVKNLTNEKTLLIAAMKMRWIGPAVMALMLINLPIIALCEEYLFRLGTNGWRHAIFRSVLFGLAHLTANAPFGAVAGTTLAGMWFSYWYFRGGIMLSAQVHFAYTLPIVVLGIGSLLRHHFGRAKT
jgi:membrane protease YdiL (CAAX protease family)